METKELIVVEQLPVITEKLRVVSNAIQEKISHVMALGCNEDTVKAVKTLRADLNKDFEAFEVRRKAVKSAVMQPYEQFEEVYKKFVATQYEQADVVLKERIDFVQDTVKAYKENDLRDYFAEYRANQGLDFVKYEDMGIEVTISTTLKKYKEKVKAFLDRVCTDLELIETQEYKDEILVEYRQSLDVSRSITVVQARRRALEEQEKRRLEQEQRREVARNAAAKVEQVVVPLTPPTEVKPVVVPEPEAPSAEAQQDDDPVLELVFKVTAPLSKLRTLKSFLNEGGYQYE